MPGAGGQLTSRTLADARNFLRKEARWFPEGSLAELPNIDADPHRFDIRRFDLRPGDAIFFDFLTVHGAPGFPHQGRAPG